MSATHDGVSKTERVRALEGVHDSLWHRTRSGEMGDEEKGEGRTGDLVGLIRLADMYLNF
jgi:hypothetical protein